MSASTSVTVARTFEELARLAKFDEDDDDDDEPEPGSLLRIRVTRADGITIEGLLADVEPTQLALLDDATQRIVEVASIDVRALEVEMPRRGREWALASVGIFVATAALLAYAMLPWVRPTEPFMSVGFMILFVAGAATFRKLPGRAALRRWVTRWKSLYPPPGPG